MTIDLFLVRHSESCSNIQRAKNTDKNSTYRLGHNGVLYEPTLSIRGYIQTFQLRDYILKSKTLSYDKVICSPLIRTVVTAMISLSTFNDEENKNVIYIVPYVKIHTTKLSKINRVSELKDKIHNFKLWFHISGIHLYQLYREKHSTKQVTTIHFPRIDYKELEDYEDTFRENERIQVTDQFREYISRLNVSSLIIFTHKRFIMRVADISNEPKNSSITKITVDTENETNRVTTHIYQPSTKKHRITINRKYQIEQCNASKSFLTRTTRRKYR
jgi:hypothetical protein